MNKSGRHGARVRRARNNGTALPENSMMESVCAAGQKFTCFLTTESVAPKNFKNSIFSLPLLARNVSNPKQSPAPCHARRKQGCCARGCRRPCPSRVPRSRGGERKVKLCASSPAVGGRLEKRREDGSFIFCNSYSLGSMRLALLLEQATEGRTAEDKSGSSQQQANRCKI